MTIIYPIRVTSWEEVSDVLRKAKVRLEAMLPEALGTKKRRFEAMLYTRPEAPLFWNSLSRPTF
jgi:hypothetical protein